VPTPEVEVFARALCGQDTEPQLFAQATRIAENEMVVRVIRERRISAVERLRDVTEVAFAKPDNSLRSARAVLRESKRAYAELKAALPAMLAKYKDQLGPADGERHEPLFGDIVPLALNLLLKGPESLEEEERLRELARQQVEERDEIEALQAAVQDLIRIECYERRIWSRQRRAIRAFVNLRFMLKMASIGQSRGKGS
jgi:hypothetical protein